MADEKEKCLRCNEALQAFFIWKKRKKMKDLVNELNQIFRGEN